MNIIIVGCGNVGYILAEQLSKEGHEITLIDTKAERLKYVGNVLGIKVLDHIIIGDGYYSFLENNKM